MPPDSRPDRPFRQVRDAGSRLLPAAVAILAIGLVAITAARAARSSTTEAHLGFTEGTWIGLALDAANGVVYRPLDGPLGFGGTRYFPGFFLLHALAIRAGVDPIAAGHVLATLSVIAALAALVLLLRRLGVDTIVAIAAAALALSSQAVQLAVVTIRGDALAVAFGLLGAALSVAPARVVWAAAAFALAFATKPTSLYLAAGVIAFLAWHGDRRSAARLAAWTSGAVVLVALGILLISHGRIVEVLAASASGGSTSATLLSSPLTLARMLRRTPETALWVQLAVVWLLFRRPVDVSLPAVLLAASVCATLVIFASPATVENHLIDMAILTVALLATTTVNGAAWRRGFLLLAIVTGVAAGLAATWRLREEDGQNRRASREAALAALPAGDRPVFTEQPMLAAKMGEPPRVLDSYIFLVSLSHRPGYVDRLVEDVLAQRYRALVFEQASPESTGAGLLSGAARERLLDALARAYEPSNVAGRVIYRPRSLVLPAADRAGAPDNLQDAGVAPAQPH